MDRSQLRSLITGCLFLYSADGSWISALTTCCNDKKVEIKAMLLSKVMAWTLKIMEIFRCAVYLFPMSLDFSLSSIKGLSIQTPYI
jgi:hypothetical protein